MISDVRGTRKLARLPDLRQVAAGKDFVKSHTTTFALDQIASYAAILRAAVSSALTISAGDRFAKSFSDCVTVHALDPSMKKARS